MGVAMIKISMFIILSFSSHIIPMVYHLQKWQKLATSKYRVFHKNVSTWKLLINSGSFDRKSSGEQSLERQ